MLTQLTKNFYHLESADHLPVLAQLRQAGYRDAPNWHFSKRGCGLFITPKTTRTGFVFRLWAEPSIVDMYRDHVEQLPIEQFVYQLREDGWHEHMRWWLIGHRTAVSMIESTHNADEGYYLDIRGFEPQPVRACLKRLGSSSSHDG